MEKILVINNDFDTMNLLKDLLKKRSYKVSFTTSGSDSTKLALKFKPDVVLVDILQRDSIEQLRAHPATAYIPVIMMTGYSWNEKVNEIDADEVIEKPFLLDQLQQKIDLVISRRSQNARKAV